MEGDEPIEPLKAAFQEDNAEEDMDVEEVDEIEEINDLEEEEYVDEISSASERFMDATPVSIASSRLIEGDVDVDAGEDDSVETVFMEQDADKEAVDVDIRQEMTGDVTFDKIEAASLDKAAFAKENEMSLQDNSGYVPDRAKEVLQDVSKVWWTNVWMEQTSEEMPELEEEVSDESDAGVSVSVATDDMQGSSKMTDLENDEMEIDTAVADVGDVEAQETKERELQITDDPVSQLAMRLEEEVETLEIVEIEADSTDVESLKEAPQGVFEAVTSQDLVSDTVAQVEFVEKEESPFVSSGYVRTFFRHIFLHCEFDSTLTIIPRVFYL